MQVLFSAVVAILFLIVTQAPSTTEGQSAIITSSAIASYLSATETPTPARSNSVEIWKVSSNLNMLLGETLANSRTSPAKITRSQHPRKVPGQSAVNLATFVHDKNSVQIQ